MAAATFDPITLQTILANLPEVQRRKKQAEKLRRAQGQFESMQGTRLGPNYQPTTTGGLGYETISKYSPDYAGLTQQAVGAIGNWYTGRQADQADASLQDFQNQQILQTVEQLGQQRGGATPAPGAPSEATLRAYLGMLGGPDVQTIIGKTPHVSSRTTDENGNVVLHMSDGSSVSTGIKADYSTQVVTGQGGKQYAVGKSGAGRGIANEVVLGGGPNPMAPGGSADMSLGTAIQDDPEAWYQAVEQTESGGRQGAVSPKGAQGVMQLMPGTAREMEAALGLPPGSTSTDENANRAAGRAYLDQRMQARNGDRSLALMDYNWGQGNVDKWLEAGADPSKVPKETQDYVRKVTQRATAGRQVAGPTPLIVPTKAEEAGAAETAKINAQNALAAQTAQAKAIEKGAVVDAETAGKIRAELPAMKQFKDTAESVANQLLNHKGLDQIVGGLGGRIPDGPTAQAYFRAVMAGTPAADAMALHNQLKGEVFLQAFKTLKGGGQITEIEGQKAEQALARMDRAQSKEAYKKAVTDFIDAMNAGYAKLEAVGMGGGQVPSAPVAPARSVPQLPPGFSWED